MTAAPPAATPPAVAPRRRPPAVLVALATFTTAIDALLLALALGGFDALLAHPRALALLAVYFVTAVVLALIRPVRGQDPVAATPDPPLVLLALGLVPLLVPPLSAFSEARGVGVLPLGDAYRWAGVALAAAGLSTRIAAMAQLRDRFSPRLVVQRAHALETRGLYARVRHPGYLGTLLAAFGAALTFASLPGLIAAAIVAALLQARVRREEALLERHFGDDWRAYRARSGAFLPRLGPRG